MNIGRLVYICVWYRDVLLLLCGCSLFAGIPSSVSAKAIYGKHDNKHLEKSNKKPRVNSWSVKDHLTQKDIFMLLPPTVTVSIGNQPQFQRHKLSLPLIPDMTILDLLVAAVKKTITDNKHTSGHHHDSRTDTESSGASLPEISHHTSPFDVVIQWDDSLGCFAVLKALGTENDDLYAWRFRIRDRHHQVIYKGHCLPSREDVTLRPSDRVSISYLRSTNSSRSMSHGRSRSLTQHSRL